MKGSLEFWDDLVLIQYEARKMRVKAQCEKIWRTTTETKTETNKEWAKVKVARSRLLCKASLCRWRSWRARRRGGSRPDGRIFKKQSKGFCPRLPTCGFITLGKIYFFYLVAKNVELALHYILMQFAVQFTITSYQTWKISNVLHRWIYAKRNLPKKSMQQLCRFCSSLLIAPTGR